MVPQWIDGGDLWKSKARSLQLRLKDRFRVAVDRHRHKPLIFAEGYFSATVQRWLQRFHEFRQDSLPSSPSFYRKRVSKDFNAEDDSVLLRMLQAVAVPILGNMCHVFMHGLNTVQVYGVEKLHEAVLNRPKGRPLLTVSNHVAAVDDPFVIAALLPPNVLLDAENLRWTLCATDRCFRNPATSAFFKSVKVLPVARGDGLYQKGMDMAISKLNNGGWVHIFPEGSRSRDGGKTFGSAKRGVGRLVLDADNVPMVVPFVHAGMQDIMPIGAKVPRIGKTVIVIVGDPIQFDDLLISQGSENISRGKLYDSAASRIGHRLQELKNQLDNLVLEQANQLCNQKKDSSNRALGLIHQIDWEAFGLGSLLEEEYSLKQSPQAQHHPQLGHHEQDVVSTDRYFKMGFSHQGRFMSRMRGFVDPSEFMGFAARGLFVNHHKVGDVSSDTERRFSPLRTWKQFLEANTLRPRRSRLSGIAKMN